jgi:hypothetical protein
MTVARTAGASRAFEAVRAVGAVLVVAAGALALLALLDGVPAWVTGEPREVRRARSVDEAERALRARLLVPAYFPASLSWPPERVRFTRGPPGAAALTVNARGGSPRVFLAETIAPGPIPGGLVPDVEVLDRSPVAIGATRGTLSRIIEDGGTAWELAWEQNGRSLLLRSRGSVEELLRMARSTREEQ